MVNIEEKCEILQHLAACVPENAAGESEDNLLQNFCLCAVTVNWQTAGHF